MKFKAVRIDNGAFIESESILFSNTGCYMPERVAGIATLDGVNIISIEDVLFAAVEENTIEQLEGVGAPANKEE